MLIGSVLVFAPLAVLLAAASVGEASSFETQTILAFVVPKLIEWMKGSEGRLFGWVSGPRVSKLVSGIIAGLLTLGVVVSFEGDIWTAQGATVTISQFSIPTLIHALAAFLFQWGFQHVSWQMFWKKG